MEQNFFDLRQMMGRKRTGLQLYKKFHQMVGMVALDQTIITTFLRGQSQIQQKELYTNSMGIMMLQK